MFRHSGCNVCQYLASRTDEKGSKEVVRLDSERMVPVYSCTVFEECAPIHFNQVDRSIYVATNKGQNTNVIELDLLDPQTGQTSLVEKDPKNSVDLQKAFLSDVADRLLAIVYDDDRKRISWKDRHSNPTASGYRTNRLDGVLFRFACQG